jgi:membrane protein YdbS with pleckstrin-like domain
MLARSKLFVPYGTVRAQDVDLYTGGSTISVRNNITTLNANAATATANITALQSAKNKSLRTPP